MFIIRGVIEKKIYIYEKEEKKEKKRRFSRHKNILDSSENKNIYVHIYEYTYIPYFYYEILFAPRSARRDIMKIKKKKKFKCNLHYETTVQHDEVIIFYLTAKRYIHDRD